MADIHQLVCNKCGDPDVMTDAWASMNPETGEMELEHDFENGWCKACEADIQRSYTHKKPSVLMGSEKDVYEKACDDADCVCRQHVSWPDNIASGCAARAEL